MNGCRYVDCKHIVYLLVCQGQWVQVSAVFTDKGSQNVKKSSKGQLINVC